MLSMVNSEHQAGTTQPAGAAGPTASGAADGYHHHHQYSGVPTPDAQRASNDENAEPRQRNIPVQVLVRHEEYTSSTATHSGDQSGDESSSSMLSTGKPSAHDATSNRPREKRSTKSKCPPGLRSGKWTPEEEAFTNMIIYYFKLGRLHVEDGTSLRWYLAKRLNCEAMRVTKKLKGNSSIGKQIFRALEETEESRRAIEAAAEELAVVEKAFLDSLSSTGQTIANCAASSAASTASLAAAAVAAAVRKRSSPHKPMGSLKPPHLEARKLVVPKVKNSLANSEDAKLLLHFFEGAHESTPDENVSVEKKRLFSEVDTSPSTTSSQADSPESKRRVVDMDDMVGPV